MRRTVALAFLLLAPLFAETRELDLTPGGGWVDTGIELKPGDTFRVTASGSVKYFDAKQENGPEGLNRGWADLIRALPVNEAGRGAVVGRIGTSAAARAFLIGAQHEGTAPVAGRLYVGVNEPEDSRGTGSFHLKIERTAAASSPKTGYHLPEFTQELLDAIPRRVTDAAGGAGDRVNFIVIGPQEKMQAAFKAAGWVIADRTERDAVLAGLIATLSKEAYVTMPMSTLYLFGRPQDFGYAQADPMSAGPLTVSQLIVHGTADEDVPYELSRRYALNAGERAALVTLPETDHFDLIDPASAAWDRIMRELVPLLPA